MSAASLNKNIIDSILDYNEILIIRFKYVL